MGIPGHITEDIDCFEDVIRCQCSMCLNEKLRDRFHAAGLIRWSAESELCGRIGKADVVELDFVKPSLCRLHRDGDIVGSNFGLERVSPCEVLAISEDGAAGEVNSEIRAGRCKRIVLEGHNSSDHVYSLTVAVINKIRERLDGCEPAGTDRSSKSNVAGIDDKAVVALNVDDKGVGSATVDNVEGRVSEDARRDAVLRQVEGLDGKRSKGKVAVAS